MTPPGPIEQIEMSTTMPRFRSTTSWRIGLVTLVRAASRSSVRSIERRCPDGALAGNILTRCLHRAVRRRQRRRFIRHVDAAKTLRVIEPGESARSVAHERLTSSIAGNRGWFPPRTLT